MRKIRIDFKAINEAALRQSLLVAMHYASHGKKQSGEWVALNPSRNDKTARSFSLNLNTGVWSDFSSGDRGADIVSYVAYCTGQSQGDAAKDLARFLGIDHGDAPASCRSQRKPSPATPASDFAPVFPPPIDAAKCCPTIHPKHGNASHFWDYLSREGEGLLMRVCRFDLTEADGSRRKTYAPLAYGERTHKGRVQAGWQWRQLPSNRPLYGLNQLGAASVDRVVLTEGEKACDAARLLFPSVPCLTWSGGVKALEKSDWAALAGLEVWYWPDNDQPGAASVSPLASLLARVGVEGFRVLDVSLFPQYQPRPLGSEQLLQEAQAEWLEGYDAYDAWHLGWRPEHMAVLESMGAWQPVGPATASLVPVAVGDPVVAVDESAAALAPTVAPNAPEPQSLGGFRVDAKGVFAFDGKSESYRRICAPIEVVAQSRCGDNSGRGWGILTKFRDFDGVQKQWAIPRQMFATDGGSEVVRGLLDRGLEVDAHRESRRKLLDFIQITGNKTAARVLLVNKMGWHKTAFVLPEKTLGISAEPVLFEGEGATLCKVGERGTLAGWRDRVAAYCVGNPLALFAVSTAFVAPLLEVLGEETTGIHLFGDSSWGKSTLLNIACSVMGNPAEYKNTWRSTDNAMEANAAAHSDMLFALDEINQVDSRIIGDIVYMLGNGQGKARANDKGGARDTRHRWRLAFLSNGEKTLEQYLADAGKTLTGGMEMRFLGIRASLHDDESTQKQLGVFNDCQGLKNGAALSDHFKTATAEQHGTAFPAFLQALINELEKDEGKALIIKIRQSIERFKARHLQERGGQVDRAASKFALIGLAGELASAWGVTGWPKGAAWEAAAELFGRWLIARGGSGNMEEAQILRHLQGVFQKNAERNFKRWDRKNNGMESTVIDEHVPAVVELWGFRCSRVVGLTPTYSPTNYQKAKAGEAPEFEGAAMGEYSELDFLVPDLSFRENICKGIDHKRAAKLLDKIGALDVPPSLRAEGKLYSRLVLPNMGQKKLPCYKINFSKLMAAGDEQRNELGGGEV